MPAIPTVQLPQGANAQPQGPRADPGMYNPQFAAAQRVGGALEGLGDLGFRVKSIYDQSAITKSATTLQAAHADFENSLLDPSNPKNGDPSTYGARWDAIKQKTLTTIAKDPAVKSMSPVAQMELKTMQDSVLRRADQAVTQRTREQMVSQAVAINSTDMQLNVQAGNEGGALERNDYMEHHRLISPEQAGKNRLEILRQIDLVNFTKLETMDPMTSNGGPQVALKALQERDDAGNYKNFTRMLPDQRQQAEFHASRTLNIVRGQIANELQQQSLAGSPPDRMHIEDLVTRNLISRTEANAYLKPGPKEFDAEATASLISRAASYDKSKDPDFSEYSEHALMAADKRVPEAQRAQANKLLNERFKDMTSPTNSEAFKTGNKIIDESFGNGVYGKFKQRVPDKDSPTGFSTKTFPKAMAVAQKNRADAQTALLNYVKQNPEATPSEVEQFVHGVTAPHVEARAAQAINNPGAPAKEVGIPTITTREEWAKLPSGTEYIRDGVHYRRK